MQIEVVNVRPFNGNHGFKGWASVKFTDGNVSIIINDYTIGETKTGKLIAKAPERKNLKDNKYYPYVFIEGDFFWTVSNAIVEAYKATTMGSGDAKSNVERARDDGVKATVAKVGRFDPFADA